MEQEFILIKMEIFIKANLIRIFSMEKELLFLKMEISMKAIGKMI